MSQWIDFKKLRRELNFETVLIGYGVTPNIRPKEKGRQHIGLCPLPPCRAKSAKKTFSANVDMRIWQCFGCRSKGNVLDFVAIMEGLDISSGADMRKAALIAKEKFLSDESGQQGSLIEETEQEPMKTVVNAPLDFELKSLDPNHPWFSEQGLSKETVKHFGLGYCSKGWLKGRIAIPLYDNEKRLIGYAGRLLNESQATETNPLYLFPKSRIYKGIRYNVKISSYPLLTSESIINSKPIVAPDIELLWHIWQCGFQNVIFRFPDEQGA